LQSIIDADSQELVYGIFSYFTPEALAIRLPWYDGMRAAIPQQTASELELGPSDEETAALLAAQRAAIGIRAGGEHCRSTCTGQGSEL